MAYPYSILYISFLYLLLLIDMDPPDFDIERFRLTPETRVGRKRKVRTRKVGDWFLKGPIPGEWLSSACRLSQGALRVALAVRYLAGVARSDTVRLTGKTLIQFAVPIRTSYRALAALEAAGLVTVVRAKGSCPIVTIVEI